MTEFKKHGQLSRQLTGLLFFVLLINTIFAVFIAGYFFKKEYTALMQSRAETVGSHIQSFLIDTLSLGFPISALSGVENELDKAIKGKLKAIYANVVNAQGRIEYSAPLSKEMPPFKAALMRKLILESEAKTFPIGEAYNTFIPLIHPISKKTVGAINIGIPKRLVFHKTLKIQLILVYVFGAFIVVTLILIYFITKHAIKPLEMLNKGALSLAGGNLSARMTIAVSNEIGSLADTFNYMAAKLEQNHQELKKYNQNLEQMAEDRTAALQRSNRDLETSRKAIKRILEQIPLGILTLNKEKLIDQEYSAYMHTLFGKNREIAGQKVENLFFWEAAAENDRKSFAEWIDLVFDDSIDWNLIAELGPTLIEHKLSGKRYYYQNEYNRIMRDGEVESLMVIVSDVTRQKELEAAIKEQEKVYGQEMEFIAAIINHNYNEFGTFLEKSAHLLKNARMDYDQLLDDGINHQVVNNLFRLMHTLKGNSRAIGVQELGELAHITEDILSGIRDGAPESSNDPETRQIAIETVAFNLAEIEKMINKAEEVFQKIPGNLSNDLGKIREKKRPLKIDEKQLDELLVILSQLQKASHPAMSHYKTQIEELQSGLRELKLQDLDVLYKRLSIVVEDVAKANGKQARLILECNPVKLDVYAHNEVSNALLHLMRNAVDHGLEPPDLRESIGKPRSGTVILSVSKDQEKLMIRVKDDGKGIDTESVLRKALQKGLITSQKAASLNKEEILSLVFLPGFSSRDEVTAFSGRGVGMDIVSNAALKLNGSVRILSEIGKGTEICLTVPLKRYQ